MTTINVVRLFKMADGIYPKDIPVGRYVVDGQMSYPETGTVSERCAEVALSEGYAEECEKKDAGRLSRKLGTEKPYASSQAARVSKKKTAKKRRAGGR